MMLIDNIKDDVDKWLYWRSPVVAIDEYYAWIQLNSILLIIRTHKKSYGISYQI